MGDLPDEIASGGFLVTFSYDQNDDKSERYSISFYWDEQRRPDWILDIAEGPGQKRVCGGRAQPHRVKRHTRVAAARARRLELDGVCAILRRISLVSVSANCTPIVL